MLRRSKLVVAAAVAASVLSAVPAGASDRSAALQSCQVAPLFGIEDGWQIVAVAGFYRAPVDAIDVQLTCGVVVGGLTYGVVPDKVPGPGAVLAGTATVPNGEVGTCYTLRIRYLSGASTFTDTCP